MAKQPKAKVSSVQQATVSVARQKTIDNRLERLERHLRKFPNDVKAKEALKHEKPQRKASKQKGNFPKAKAWACDEKSGFKRSIVSFPFMNLEYFVPKINEATGEVEMRGSQIQTMVNPVISQAWSEYKSEKAQKSKAAREAKAAELSGQTRGHKQSKRARNGQKASAKKA